MAKPELDNLVEINQLKVERRYAKEYDGMLKSARRALTDAQNESIETDSQFDLAIEAAHKFALAILRRAKATARRTGSRSSRRSCTPSV
jgi:hypothetical protein